MIYIVRVYDGESVYEYEYGNLKHAKEQLAFEAQEHSKEVKADRAELYEYKNGIETLLEAI